MTSRNANRRSAGWKRNSTVPAFSYWAALARRTAAARRSRSSSGVERDALGLLDHLLVAPLHAAVADTDRPHRAVGVGDELHLDVAGIGHDALHEHGRVAEGLQSLGAGTSEGLGQCVVDLDPPDPTAAPSRRRLDHQRIPHRGGVATGLVDRLDGSAAPWRDRDLGVLGQQLGCDLVAETAHDVRTRADEDDAEPLAQLCELRTLGHEPPPDPRRVSPRRDQRPLQGVQVEVGASRVGRPAVVDAHRLVGLAHEHRGLFGPRVQRDRPDVDAVFVAQLPHHVDQPHRRLAAVDDGDAAERPVHRGRAYVVGLWPAFPLRTGAVSQLMMSAVTSSRLVSFRSS